MQTLNPLVPIFISKIDMQGKETITSNRYWWKFPALGWLFLQYLSGPENPICTGYWWKILRVTSDTEIL